MKQAAALDKLKAGAGHAVLPRLLKRRRTAVALLWLGALLIVAVVLAAAVGSAGIPIGTVYQVMLHKLPFVDSAPTWTSNIETIIIDIRLPRVVMAALVGASLAIAGAVYQGLFRNPLADPYLIGVAQGSALGAVVGFLLPAGWMATGLGTVQVAAFAGGLVAAVAVYLLARVGRTLPMTTVILAGVALGAFFVSVESYLVLTASDRFRGIVSWLMGGLYLSNWSEVRVMVPYLLAGAALIFAFGRQLNVMQLDDEQAQQLGVHVERVKIILLVAATLVTAAAVSFAGTIGFVGIMVPHAVRLLWGPDHRFLLPLSVLSGAIFMVGADALVRALGTLGPGLTELPVGVVTAFVGAPFFLYLLRQKKRAVF